MTAIEPLAHAVTAEFRRLMLSEHELHGIVHDMVRNDGYAAAELIVAALKRDLYPLHLSATEAVVAKAEANVRADAIANALLVEAGLPPISESITAPADTGKGL